MKSTRITLVVSTTIFITMLWVRQSTLPEDLSAHGRYYLISLLMISGMVSLIALFQLIRPPTHRSIALHRKSSRTKSQKRAHFRLHYEAPTQPRFIQKSEGSVRSPDFTCPVWDVSEAGISLVCTGIFSEGESIQGEIIFPSGRTAPINGVVLRVDDHRTSLGLHCSIDPPLLMAEQREQIVKEKQTGPHPAVEDASLDAPDRSLPSHTPKGICRLKRSR